MRPRTSSSNEGRDPHRARARAALSTHSMTHAARFRCAAGLHGSPDVAAGHHGTCSPWASNPTLWSPLWRRGLRPSCGARCPPCPSHQQGGPASPLPPRREGGGGRRTEGENSRQQFREPHTFIGGRQGAALWAGLLGEGAVIPADGLVTWPPNCGLAHPLPTSPSRPSSQGLRWAHPKQI